MVTKRIIPCLDVKDGWTVKGINFEGLKQVGDPVDLGKQYSNQGADELVYLDISASIEGRSTFKNLVSRIAEHINIPFTVGGGISRLADAEALFKAGADKITINTAAVNQPELISEIASKFGTQAVVVAIDAQMDAGGDWWVYTHGGRNGTKFHLYSWAERVEKLGAGEILFTSMNHDGTKQGFACETYRDLSSILSIPIIASGGGGLKQHFKDVLEDGVADAALAASIFHYNEIPIQELKQYLFENNINIRLK